MLTGNVQVDINMFKLLYLAELVDANIKYIARNTILMMSLSRGYLQILASGYPDSKFTIRFSPRTKPYKDNTVHNYVLADSLRELIIPYSMV